MAGEYRIYPSSQDSGVQNPIRAWIVFRSSCCHHPLVSITTQKPAELGVPESPAVRVHLAIKAELPQAGRSAYQFCGTLIITSLLRPRERERGEGGLGL